MKRKIVWITILSTINFVSPAYGMREGEAEIPPKIARAYGRCVEWFPSFEEKARSFMNYCTTVHNKTKTPVEFEIRLDMWDPSAKIYSSPHKSTLSPDDESRCICIMDSHPHTSGILLDMYSLKDKLSIEDEYSFEEMDIVQIHKERVAFIHMYGDLIHFLYPNLIQPHLVPFTTETPTMTQLTTQAKNGAYAERTIMDLKSLCLWKLKKLKNNLSIVDKNFDAEFFERKISTLKEKECVII